MGKKNKLTKFELQTRKQEIARAFEHIMILLGLDVKDPSLKDTPNRVAKMYAEELCATSLGTKLPKMTVFPNSKAKGKINQMLIVKDIDFASMCEHHFMPFMGKAHIAYIPGKKVLGLSKFNRLVKYYAAQPQVQERLTQQIGESLVKLLGNNVAVVMEASHLCCKIRGTKDATSYTTTSFLSGKFSDSDIVRQEFLSLLKR